jgi:hypothetical protein
VPFPIGIEPASSPPGVFHATSCAASSANARAAAAVFLSGWTWRTSERLERLGARTVLESTVLLVREKIDAVEKLVHYQ